MLPNVQLPSFVSQIISLLLRHALTGLAGTLVTMGVLDTSTSNQFVTVALGLIVGAAGVVWSIIQKKTAITTLAAAIAAPMAQPVTAMGIPVAVPPASPK